MVHPERVNFRFWVFVAALFEFSSVWPSVAVCEAQGQLADTLMAFPRGKCGFWG